MVGYRRGRPRRTNCGRAIPAGPPVGEGIYVSFAAAWGWRCCCVFTLNLNPDGRAPPSWAFISSPPPPPTSFSSS
jgi:hypothetical protein